MKARYIVVFLTLVILATVAVGFVLFYQPLRNGYTVLAMPFAGWKESARQERVLGGTRTVLVGIGSPASSAFMVSAFWHLRDQKQSLAETSDLLDKLGESSQPKTLEDIAKYAQSLGYDASIKRAYLNIWSFGPYVRTGKGKGPPTPVIVEQSLSSTYPNEGQIFRVVVGMTADASNVLVQDYVFGPYYSLTRQEFSDLWKKPYRFLVIEPKDRTEANSRRPRFEKYSLKELPANVVRLRTLWYIAEEQRRLNNSDRAITLWQQLIRDADYHRSFNKTDKVYHYTALMSLYEQGKKYREITRLEIKVLNSNRDINYEKPGEPENAEAWVLLGRGFLGVGNKAKAAEYAKKALDTAPGDPAAKELLRAAL